MHPIDRLAAVLLRLDRRRLEVFPDGWGDRAVLSLFENGPAAGDPLPGLDIAWNLQEERPRIRVRRGRFTSPVSDLLPTQARTVPIELLEPAGGTRRHVVLMPAWNDHGFETRRKLARLLIDRGIGVVLFDIPFYGGRRVVAAPRQAIRTVSQFVLMGHGAVMEGRALVGAFSADGAVGVSGYSMGGNLAAFVSAVSPVPVATCPMAASHSPGPVYLDGIMAKAVRWAALGGEAGRAELRSVLGGASVLRLDPLPHHRAAVMVAASGDGFIPASAARALHAHWEGSIMHTVAGGHATLIGRNRPLLADAVVESFDRLEGR